MYCVLLVLISAVIIRGWDIDFIDIPPYQGNIAPSLRVGHTIHLDGPRIYETVLREVIHPTPRRLMIARQKIIVKAGTPFNPTTSHRIFLPQFGKRFTVFERRVWNDLVPEHRMPFRRYFRSFEVVMLLDYTF